MRWAGFCVLLCLSGQPGLAQQPYSESLVDCASLYTISNRAFPERATSEKGAKLQEMERVLLWAAIEQAQKEGHADALSHVNDLSARKAAHWDSKGLRFIFSDEFRDWMSYCRKFTAHLGIDLPVE